MKTSLLLSAALSLCLTGYASAQDEIGAANLITPESVRAASRMIKTGKTYNLGIVVDSKTPTFAPRSMSIPILQPNQIESNGLGSNGMTYNDDIFMGWLGIGISGAEYLASKEVVAGGADTWGLEAIPFEKGADGIFGVHQILIPQNGNFILESMDTRELFKDRACRRMSRLRPAWMRWCTP